MKEKIKKLLKNPIFKSIVFLISSVLGFLLVRFDGNTTLDGLISGFGLTLFFISFFSFSFSLCEAVTLFVEKDREKKEREEKKEKIKENN